MVINEVFPNPTAAKVAFEIRFPNLFYMGEKISELQLKVIDKFPESELSVAMPLVFINQGQKAGLEPAPNVEEEFGRKTWKFKSENDFQFTVSSSNLVIISKHHKTYNLDGADKFRDVIEFVLGNFFDVIPIKSIKRIGLRYTDLCPITTKDNETFKSYYESVFPTERFNISDTNEMFFRIQTKREEYNITYMEELVKTKDDDWKLKLDFDGFANNIATTDYLNVTDELHKIISEEYEKTIKEPVYEHMKQTGD